jgi:hypothetical protein
MAKMVTWRWNGEHIPSEGRFDVPDSTTTAEIQQEAFEVIWEHASLTIEVVERQTVVGEAILRRDPCPQSEED